MNHVSGDSRAFDDAMEITPVPLETTAQRKSRSYEIDTLVEAVIDSRHSEKQMNALRRLSTLVNERSETMRLFFESCRIYGVEKYESEILTAIQIFKETGRNILFSTPLTSVSSIYAEETRKQMHMYAYSFSAQMQAGNGRMMQPDSLMQQSNASSESIVCNNAGALLAA